MSLCKAAGLKIKCPWSVKYNLSAIKVNYNILKENLKRRGQRWSG